MRGQELARAADEGAHGGKHKKMVPAVLVPCQKFGEFSAGERHTKALPSNLPDGAFAVVKATAGEGKVFVPGPEVTFRGEPDGTCKLLFNSLFYGAAKPAKLPRNSLGGQRSGSGPAKQLCEPGGRHQKNKGQYIVHILLYR